MKPFLDTGFLLTLLLETDGSPTAWRLVRPLDGPLPLAGLQRLAIENRLLRAIDEDTGEAKALAAAALAQFRRFQEEQVFASEPLDYNIALRLADQWQRQLTGTIPPLLLVLWPALAATLGASHFLSFDPRTRRLARMASMTLLPATL